MLQLNPTALYAVCLVSLCCDDRVSSLAKWPGLEFGHISSPICSRRQSFVSKTLMLEAKLESDSIIYNIPRIVADASKH